MRQGLALQLMFSPYRTSPVGVLPLSPFAPDDSHQYEDVSKYSEVLEKLPTTTESPSGEFSVAPCPAYMPITRSSQLETEYDEVKAPIERLVLPMVPAAPGEGPPQGQGSVNTAPDYEVVNVPDKDQTPQVTVGPEYEAVKTGGTA